MAFSELDVKDQEDLLTRLAKYGLGQPQLRDEELVVRKDTRLELSHRSTGAFRPQLLKTSDIDMVRKWIGLPEMVGRRRYATPTPDVAAMPAARRVMQPSFGAAAMGRRAVARISEDLAERPSLLEEVRTRGLDLQALRSPQLEEIRTAARAYIRGDQRMVEAYKPLIEAFYGTFEIAGWFYTTVVVESGAVLEFGKGANVLSAWKVHIHDGGTVRSKGTLTVDCTVLQGRSAMVVGPVIAGPVIAGPVIPR